ncbi:MAG: dockerin type I repeat-containing protein [Ruminococcus sp.]|nr:dockerin type I repeat-containing protein [Ruminococcus sp.]
MRKFKKFIALTMALSACCTMAGIGNVSALEENTDTSVSFGETALPEWVPQSFDDARAFAINHGKTYIADGVICCVQKKSSTKSNVRYETVDKGSIYNYASNVLFNESYSFVAPEEPDRSDEEAYRAYEEYMWDLGLLWEMSITPEFYYEVTVYKAPTEGEICFDWVKTVGSYEYIEAELSFAVNESGEAVETDIYSWLPDSLSEYKDFMNDYGNVALHDNYIVYLNDVNYSTGAGIIFEQLGTAEIKEVMELSISEEKLLNAAGNTNHTVIVYEAVSEGTVKGSWTIARPWSIENSKTDEDIKYYEVDENLGVHEINENEFVVPVRGDANGDGELSIADAVMLQNWILCTGDLTCWQNADLCEDKVIDVFDLIMLKSELIEKELILPAPAKE